MWLNGKTSAGVRTGWLAPKANTHTIIAHVKWLFSVIERNHMWTEWITTTTKYTRTPSENELKIKNTWQDAIVVSSRVERGIQSFKTDGDRSADISFQLSIGWHTETTHERKSISIALRLNFSCRWLQRHLNNPRCCAQSQRFCCINSVLSHHCRQIKINKQTKCPSPGDQPHSREKYTFPQKNKLTASHSILFSSNYQIQLNFAIE